MSLQRIIIIGNSTSNVYGFRKELITELLKEYEVYIVAKLKGSVETMREIGCKLIEVNIDAQGTNPLNDMKLVFAYKKIISEIAPKCVLTYTIKPNVYAGMACASLGVPYIANISGLGTAVENGGVLQKITLPLYRYGLRKAHKVFFQNAANRDFMLKNKIIKDGKVAYELIPGSGVNLESFAYKDYPASETVNFVLMARLIKEKGIQQYLDAAKVIKPRYENVVFNVFGPSTPEYDDIVKRMTEEKMIIYHGYAKNVFPVYENASCVIHPTFYPEGMSNVLLESCATGRPIITTDRPGCREIVDDGVNGFVVKQRSSEDLIEKIERFLSLSIAQRRQMGIEGRKKVEREFDRNVVIGKYMQEIEKV